MDIAERLNEISDRLGENVSHVEDVKRLSGGASQETWSFCAVSPKGKRKLILRRSPFENPDGQGIGLAKEAEILRLVKNTDLPAPEVIYLFSPGDPIGSAYVMNAIDGETLPQRILRDPIFQKGKEAIPAQCGEALAKLHNIPDIEALKLPYAGAVEQINQYQALIDEYDMRRPVFELTLQWLKENVPAPEKVCMVHGDFRMGNLMIDPSGLTGILDWELCHVGDPREDIGWICVNSWRFGQIGKRVGGVGDLQPLLDAYMAAGGIQITSKEIDFWEILGSFKWGIMCAKMYDAFQSGSDPSIERGSIGRRTSEVEIDLMNLLETV